MRIAKKMKNVPKDMVKKGVRIAGKIASNDGAVIKRLLSMGIDLSTRGAVGSALRLIGESDDMAEEIYVELQNELNREGFKKVAFNRRILFLPQCLRNSQKCSAPLGEYGYECKMCGCCPIAGIKKKAEDLGYEVYIVPGGSMAVKIIKKRKPAAVLGVACMFELCEAAERLYGNGIWMQGVPLLKDGCKDTMVDVDRVMRTLSLR